MFVLPTSAELADDFYTFEADLDGVSYVFSMYWNDRAQAWFLSLSLPDGTKLYSGIRLNTMNIVGGWFIGDSAPPGRLFIFDSSGTFVDPGRYELADDKRCQLVYYTEEEWTTLIDTDSGDEAAVMEVLGLSP